MVATNMASSTQAGNVVSQQNQLQVVVGLGSSGLSAVQYLEQQGYPVAVTDGGYPTLANQLPKHIITKFGEIDGELLTKASRIIISPGINPNLAVFSAAKALNIPLVSDIQLFHEQCKQKNIPIVAITGSNAKSTVTTLVGQMAKDAGKKVGIGGNLGTPALNLLKQPIELAILELSSFQLETVSNLQAKVATVLNMSPDHLDRHGDMAGYQQIKHRIFQGVQSIVINADDPRSYVENVKDVPVITFGQQVPTDNNYGLIIDENNDIWLARGHEKLLHEKDLQIKGQHNLLNALSALALGELAGLSLDSMLQTLKNFAGLPHRCQFVIHNNGVDCYDDSKGTNIGSTIAAIEGLGKVYAPKNKRLAIILGGQGKGQDFAELEACLKTYVSHIYLIGEDAPKIASDLAGVGIETKNDCKIQIKFTQTLENTIPQAWKDCQNHAEIGVLLLSPACASLDQFSSYAERGNLFQQLVMM